MSEKLFFGNSATGSVAPVADYHHVLHQLSSLYSGVITSLKMYSLNSGGFKSNIYDSSSNLLWADDTGVSVSSGYNTISISSPIAVAASNTYKIGGVSDSGSVIIASSLTSQRSVLAAPYSSFVAPDPLTHTPSSWAYSYCFAAYGWEPPTTTSISDSTLTNGQAGVVLSGTDFMDSGAMLELCNNSVYASATIKLAQTITNQTDSALTFTVNNNNQIFGNKYLFVTTSLGQRNATPYTVNIGRTVYFFVTNNGSDRNATGFPVTLFE